MIELKPVSISEEYSKKWNEHCKDFVNIYKDGVKLRDTLYRVGGMGCKLSEKYFMILKYSEEYYPDKITKNPKEKPHLQGNWVIIGQDGKEMVEFDSSKFSSPYLQGGVVYVLDKHYYNIETGELYCSAYSSMKSQNFLFLNNQFDENKERRGVMKIELSTGLYEIIK